MNWKGVAFLNFTNYNLLFFVIINFSEYLALKQHVDQLRHKQMKLRNQRDVSIRFLAFVIIQI